MKISKSKQELARIIGENGGWRDGAEWAAQDKDWLVSYFDGSEKPVRPARKEEWWAKGYIRRARIKAGKLLPNWRSALLSREEYFHLYPAPDAKPEFCESVTLSIPEPESKPTIEQLSTEYHNLKELADRKQAETDAAKADAEAKLGELVAAGKAIGLVVSVDGVEPKLVISDLRDLRIGDIIEYVDGDIKSKNGMTGPVVEFEPDANDGLHVRLRCDNGPNKGRFGWPSKWRFIRRP